MTASDLQDLEAWREVPGLDEPLTMFDGSDVVVGACLVKDMLMAVFPAPR